MENPADSSFSPRSGVGFGYTASSSDPEELVARLDNAIRELSLVRQSLAGSSTFTTPRPPPPSDIQSDTATLVSYLRADLEAVRQENKMLRKQYNVTKEQNAALESRLHREASDSGGFSSEDTPMIPGTTRSHSAPALLSPSPKAFGKKRKLSGGGGGY